jgi:hypothetical protein
MDRFIGEEEEDDISHLLSAVEERGREQTAELMSLFADGLKGREES